MYNIVQGGVTGSSLNPFIVRLRTDPVTLDPFDLTSIYNITACFHNTDGTELMVSLLGGGISILGNPILGKILISLTAAQTLLLAVSQTEELEISIIPTIGVDPLKVPIADAYSVEQTNC